jgi:small subunit ribosomal protein S6
MRSYDVVLVFQGTVSGTQREKLLESVRKWLGEGTVVKSNDWGKKALAYPIKGETEGNYVFLEVESERGVPADFEKRLLMEEGVLRHLVLRKE